MSKDLVENIIHFIIELNEGIKYYLYKKLHI